MTKRELMAKAIRAVTVPPVMVLALLLILYFRQAGVFSGPRELLLSILFLAVIPLMAYPLSRILPKRRGKGREGRRNLALGMSLAGYAGAAAYGFAAGASSRLRLIFVMYFLSVLVLIVWNKAIGVRASGHACSLAGPMLLFVYFIGGLSILPCLLLFGAILWSSLTLRRHTLKELGLGALCAGIAFCAAWLLKACY